MNKRRESSGLDGVTIQQFLANKEDNLLKISNLLKSRKYQFKSLEGIPLPKKKGIKIDKNNPKLFRPLKVPAVSDRVVQKAIEIVIKPHLENAYQLSKNPVNFAYIKDRRLVEAVSQVRKFHHSGCDWYYKGDIEKFFDNVDQDLLLDTYIFPKLPDTTIKTLIKQALSCEIGNRDFLTAKGYPVDQIFPNMNTGIPQGGVLSPLFSNVYLSPLDQRMLSEGYNMVRYADDFIVLCSTKEQAHAAESIAREEIEKLKLNLHPLGGPGSKSVIDRFNQVKFVGIRFSGDRIYPSPEALKKFRDELVSIQRRRKNLIDDLKSIQSKVRSWGSTYYFTDIGTSEASTIYRPLNSQMRTSLKAVFSYYGLKFDSKVATKKGLQRIGLSDFDESIRIFRKSHPDKPIDYEEILRKPSPNDSET